MTEKKEEKANYTKPTSTLDLERRMADDFESPNKIVEGTVPNQLQEGGFVNVDPEYRNYANDADAPMHAEEGVYADLDNHMFGEKLAKKAREGKVTEDDIKEAREEQEAAEAAAAASESDESDDESTKSDSSTATKKTESSTSSSTKASTAKADNK